MRILCRCILTIAGLLLVLTPAIPATADGMVYYTLIAALVASASLSLAAQPLERIIAFAVTAGSIILAIQFSNAEFDMLRRQKSFWMNKATAPAMNAASTAPAARTTP